MTKAQEKVSPQDTTVKTKKINVQQDTGHVDQETRKKASSGKNYQNLGSYYQQDLTVDFRKNPHLYRIGRGEQGVLMCEPYKSEIGQHWRFKTPKIAKESSDKIYNMFLGYLKQEDFVGADMARKYLMMGWTRARRYANHKSGKKYDTQGCILPIEKDCIVSEKSKSAEIFKEKYDLARNNEIYLDLKFKHKRKYS